MERGSQIAALDEVYRQCIAGNGGISLITGQVASGKTELLKVFADRLRAEDATVLEAVGSRHERDQSFGILQQLFIGLSDRHGLERIRRLLSDSAARLPDPSGDGTPLLRNHAKQELWATLHRLAERAPVVLIVDDLQHADLASLHTLLWFGDRVRSARVMIVATRTDLPLSADQQRAVLITELLRQPRFRLLRADPLTSDGVREMLTAHAGIPVETHRAEAWHRLTCGSPFLLKALIADSGSPTGQRDEPAAGPEFARATLACLHRGGACFLKVARGLAILGESGAVSVIPQLIGEDEETTAGVIAAMNVAGLLDDRRFRHPAARAAVLRELAAADRAELHTRAAELLHNHAADPHRVGIHLVAAGAAPHPWAFEVLLGTVREALDRDDREFAAKALRLAGSISTTAAQQVSVAVLGIHVGHRSTCDIARAQLAIVLDAVRADTVDSDEMIGLLRPLLWQGRVVEAEVILRQLDNAADRLEDHAAADLFAVRVWLRSTHPGLMSSAGHPTELSDGAQVAVVANRFVRGPALLADVLETGPTDHTVPTAEWLLRTTTLDGGSLNSIVSALFALAHAERTDLAAHWCTALLRESVERRAPTWQALFTATRADIAWRRGDMTGARRDGLAALGLLPRSAWGMALGFVLSKVMVAATALGDWQTADGCLLELPDAMFDTTYGVQYLYARGRRLLAADRYRAALDDLRTCGRLMGEWGIDQPTFLPWRADAVRALLGLGQRDEAAALAAEQISRAATLSPRAHGIALRALAATEFDPTVRRDTLTRAIESLEDSAEPVELAYALADLGETQILLGEPRRARSAADRAGRIAADHGLTPLVDRLNSGRRAVEPVSLAPSPGAEKADILSAAERRVVLLAANGRTNREIAAELYITVSTVEQHLTHVYRKLGVKGRGDLAAHLADAGLLAGIGLGQRGAA
ncbi:helix-turn-helix transcriptional regulator [Nocardia sp. SYP-A9097]|uniref:helix-turn-helix transcriptional regulator n=1 Tax=Nocardia sp. SYP-A9097 TaxID=2663237 RepID=UPI001890B62A|nr:AAA family ATPase [Nocardia sp. SYP-A9097]